MSILLWIVGIVLWYKLGRRICYWMVRKYKTPMGSLEALTLAVLWPLSLLLLFLENLDFSISVEDVDE